MSDAVTLKDITHGVQIALEEMNLSEGFYDKNSEPYEVYSIVAPDHGGVIFVETTMGDKVQKFIIDIRPVTEWKVSS